MTYEEISTKYPIGKLLYRKIIKIQRLAFWASEKDRQIYSIKYPDAKFGENGTVIYTECSIKEKYVEGWIVTDEGFFVAEDTWDGWVIIDQDDLDEYEQIGIESSVCEF